MIDTKYIEVEKGPAPIRENLITGTRTFISTVRGNRYHEMNTRAEQPNLRINEETGKENDPFADPIHPANDPPVLEIRHPQGKRILEVIPNLWPLVCNEEKERFDPDTIIGPGFHEVLIMDDRYATFADYSEEYIRLVLRALARRFVKIHKENPSIQEISIFQCYGLQSGGSQPHPHIQLFASSLISNETIKRIKLQKYFTIYDEVEMAQKDKRVVYENQDCIVICPYAPATDFSMYVVPKQDSIANSKEYGSIMQYIDRKTPGTLAKYNISNAIRTATRALKYTLNDPPYNIFFNNGGFNKNSLNFFIEIRPTYDYKPFGLQPITGDNYITVTPEISAQVLRDTIDQPHFNLLKNVAVVEKDLQNTEFRDWELRPIEVENYI